MMRNQPGFGSHSKRERGSRGAASVLRFLGGAAPLVGGAAGALIGGIAGAPAGGIGAIPGAAAGAGIGTSLGGAAGMLAGAGADEMERPYDEAEARRQARMNAIAQLLSQVRS